MASLVQSFPLALFLFILAFPLGMAGVAIFAGLQARRRAALVQATPTSKIGMAADGYCEFEGVVEAIEGRTLVAPLTQAPCVWYHARVERWAGRGASKGGDNWSTIKEATSAAPFFVRDSTGVCAVHPFDAEVTPTDKSLWYGATAIPTDRNPPRLGPTDSTSSGVKISGGPNTKFQYYEERIYAGDPLLVLGDFSQGRFNAPPDQPDEDEGDEAAADSNDEEAAEFAEIDAAWDDHQVVDELNTRAEQTTRAWIGKGLSGNPLIVSTTLQAVHVVQTAMGSRAALAVALVPLGIAALLIYARFA